MQEFSLIIFKVSDCIRQSKWKNRILTVKLLLTYLRGWVLTLVCVWELHVHEEPGHCPLITPLLF